MRGDDHLTNTPRQILILQALGLPIPTYAHLSLITGNDGAPLSKRNGSCSIDDLRKDGYIPIAILNYLARLGHYYESHQLMSLSELATCFSMKHLSASPARFDAMQLLHWQKLSVLAASDEWIWNWFDASQQAFIPISQKNHFIELIRHNCLFPKAAHQWFTILCQDEPLVFEHDALEVLQKTDPHFFEVGYKSLSEKGLDLNALIDDLKTHCGVKGQGLYQPLRVALTGALHGPELLNIVALLGKDRAIARFNVCRKNPTNQL
jgi:glutamyl-tRNA synthetase